MLFLLPIMHLVELSGQGDTANEYMDYLNNYIILLNIRYRYLLYELCIVQSLAPRTN